MAGRRRVVDHWNVLLLHSVRSTFVVSLNFDYEIWNNVDRIESSFVRMFLWMNQNWPIACVVTSRSNPLIWITNNNAIDRSVSSYLLLHLTMEYFFHSFFFSFLFLFCKLYAMQCNLNHPLISPDTRSIILRLII